MHNLGKQSIVLLIVCTLLLAPFNAMADSPADEDDQVTAGKMVADALVVRPLGIVALIAGTAVFIVSLPFSALGGNTDKAFEHMMVKPAKFTFQRPLGEF